MRIVRSVPDEVQLVGPIDGHAHMLLVETFNSSYYLDGSPGRRSGIPSGVLDAGSALPQHSSIPACVQVSRSVDYSIRTSLPGRFQWRNVLPSVPGPSIVRRHGVLDLLYGPTR